VNLGRGKRGAETAKNGTCEERTCIFALSSIEERKRSRKGLVGLNTETAIIPRGWLKGDK